MAEPRWTEARVETLRSLWAEGQSAAHIADRLGADITRNAVIGKVHRLGLPGRATTSRRRRPRSSNLPHPRRPHHSRSPQSPGPAASKQAPTLAEPTPLGIDLLALKAGRCKWPYGDPKRDFAGFCGHAATATYCDFHHVQAHR